MRRDTIERVKGAPITVTCHCGETQHVPYGDTWQCGSCGRRWNTSQIPSDVYWELMREMRNYRLAVIGVALGLAAVFGLLAFVVSGGVLLIFPVVLTAWFIWFMPWWRRRLRRRARNLPNWQLTPE